MNKIIKSSKGPKNLMLTIISVLGVIVLAAYLNFALGLFNLSEFLTLMLAFLIGPVAIIGVIFISHRLGKIDKNISLKIAIYFLVIAFSLFTLMIVIQQSVFFTYDTLKTDTQNADFIEILRLNFKLVNQVQLGIDVTFDIFYCIGMIFMSAVLFNHGLFGKTLSIYGILTAAGLLILNLATFPNPPAEAGAFDIGPLTAVWWIGLIIFIRKIKPDKEPD